MGSLAARFAASLAVGATVLCATAPSALSVAASGTAPIPAAGATTPVASTTTAPPTRWPALKPGESYGVDVSSYQGSVSWTAAAQSGVAFAYIKATQGSTYVNPYFQAQWDGAKAAGLAYGAYAFFSLCSSGAAQAQSFLATVPRDPAALPPAVDLELEGNCLQRPKAARVGRQLGTFVATVEKATGHKVVLYLGWDFAAWYPGLSLLRHRQLWLDDGPMPGKQVVIWQSPDPTQVSGISDVVDLDIARLSTLRRA